MADRLSVLKYYLYYKYRRQPSSRCELIARQEKKLKKHLAYVSVHSEIYLGMESLNQYPVIDKAYMMEHFNEINTVGIDRDRALDFAVRAERERSFEPKLQGVTVGLSSGTSGRRGIFLVSDQEKDRWAGYILARFLPGGILQPCTIAFFMRADSNLYEAVRSKNIQFHFFDIYREMEEHRQRLEQIQPRVLAGQPSLLLMIAEDIQRGNLSLRPQVVISIAEVLEKEDEGRLKQAFGLAVIHQVYQCTEGCLATTCSCGTLHLNEDIVYIEREYLDERRFVPVVTDLERRAQPIIRYRLNDILVERKEPCGCGSPRLALEKIEGRQDDMFTFKDSQGREKLVFPDFIRRCILFADSGCENPGAAETAAAAVHGTGRGDYRIVQETDGRITVYADLEEGGRSRVLREFERLARDQGVILPELVFQPYRCERGRKMKRVERRRPEQCAPEHI